MSSSTKRPFGDMSPNSSRTSEPAPKHQRLDTVRLSISEEEHAEQDQQVLKAPFVNVIPEQLDEPSASHLLSHIIKNARDHLNQALWSEVEKLVQTEDGLMEELQDAWSKKTFSGIRSLRMLQNPPPVYQAPSQIKNSNRPVTPPTAGALTIKNSPPIRSTTQIDESITAFRKSLIPFLKEIVVRRESSILKWNPVAPGEFFDHARSLKIPMHQNEPSLLLHDLGRPSDSEMEIVSYLFTASENKLFCNVSGAGKTRMLLQGLCTVWGFYFVCEVDSHKVGSHDLEKAIRYLPKRTRWSAHSPKDDPHAFSENTQLAMYEFRKVLLGRLIVLNLFLKLASENNVPPTDELKKLWTLIQVSPDIFEGYSGDIFEQAFDSLWGIEEHDLDTLLTKEEKEYGNRRLNELVCVIDEAQNGATKHDTAFLSDSGHRNYRPVLKPIAYVMGYRFSYILSGTAVSSEQINSAVSSGVGKKADILLFNKTGYLDSEEAHSAFMKKYLPTSYLKREAGRQLLRRSWHWLRGRYRFTTAFIELLLVSGGHCPHRVLDAFVEHFTEFCPNDGDEGLRNEESGAIPRIKVKRLYNSEQIASAAHLLRDASMIIFKYMTGRKPISSLPNSHPKDLVELGFARFLGKAVLINEPLALLSLGHWLESQRGFTMKEVLNLLLSQSVNHQGGGSHFEDVMTFYFYTVFQKFCRLDQIFNFVSPAPDWATDKARLVAYTRDKSGGYGFAHLDIHHESRPRQPSAPMATVAERREDSIAWLNDQRYVPILLPDNSMGPDHLALLEFEDGRRLWMAAQSKCQTATLTGLSLTKAMDSVTPPFFCGHLAEEKREWLQADVDKAMSSVPNLMPGNTHFLRVIACLGECNTADLSADEGPLALLNVKHLQDVTCTGAVNALANQLVKRA
ncbi:hypothetical protein K439DRAFT_1619482 [Ramaria rubella]|nr:hypothetical protein K439DRAFT_1619482 [Ramaria rubella]